MINRSPWLWNANKTAAGLTARTSNGVKILQGKRTPGQSNPSTEFIQSQVAANLLWPLFRSVPGFIREHFTTIPAGEYAANRWYADNYAGLDLSVPSTATIIPANLVFSKGLMAPTSGVSITSADQSAATVQFTWPTTITDSTQLATDIVQYVFRLRGTGAMRSGTATARSTGDSGPISVAGMGMLAGDVIDVYASFLGTPGQPNEGMTSLSVQNNATVVA